MRGLVPLDGSRWLEALGVAVDYFNDPSNLGRLTELALEAIQLVYE